MSAAALVMIIGLIGALILAVRGVRWHRLGFERTAWMAVAWVLIIIALAFVLGRIGT